MASSCRDVPTAVRSRVVLYFLSRAEPAETVCRRFRLCAQCLDDWATRFVEYGTHGLAAPAGVTPHEQELAEDAKHLARALKEAEEELTVWERLRAITSSG